MPYTQQFYGAADAPPASLAAIVSDALAHVAAGDWPFIDRAQMEADLAPIEQQADALRRSCRQLVVVGTGGSSLGGRTLCALADEARQPLRVRFLENTDSESLRRCLEAAGWQDTQFLVISKSGGTLETLSQFLILRQAISGALGEAALPKHLQVITEPGARPLRDLAVADGISVHDHHPGIGGRYSVLSEVGLLPAAAAGVDIRAVRRGAAQVLARLGEQRQQAAPALGAAWQVAQSKTRPISVMMPYVDRLEAFAAWYAQLWAESLGKDGKGTTPVRALGAVDQHSQLQLYLGGPDDKCHTMIHLQQQGQGPAIDTRGHPSLQYCEGRTLGDVMEALQRGTADALAAAGRPVRALQITAVDAHTVGELLMHFMLETILAAGLLGVNAFDQPAVEAGKIRARAYLSGETA